MNIQQLRKRIKTPEAMEVFNEMKEIVRAEFCMETTQKDMVVTGVDEIAYFLMVVISKASKVEGKKNR